MKKADIQPPDGAAPNHLALDETVIQVSNGRYWVYAADKADTAGVLNEKHASTRNQAMALIFPAELREKYQATNTIFLADSAPWLPAALHRNDL